MNRLRLTSGQRRGLQRQLQETPEARVYRRTLALLEYSRGRSVADIAASLHVSHRSVYRWVQAYAQGREPSALHDAARAGRPRLWTTQRQALLRTLLDTSPAQWGYFAVNWTVPLLQEQIEHVRGVRLSEDTIRRPLQREHFVWKRPRYMLEADPDQEKKTRSAQKHSPLDAADGRAGGGRDRSVVVPPLAGRLGPPRRTPAGVAERLQCPPGDLRSDGPADGPAGVGGA